MFQTAAFVSSSLEALWPQWSLWSYWSFLVLFQVSDKTQHQLKLALKVVF